MEFYKPKHFKLYEMLPPDIYALYKHKGDYLWNVCFDARLLYTADRLRDRWGVVYCNDWYWGGIHKERGLRRNDTVTGAALSQHKFGRALDLKFREISAHDTRQEILNDPWCEDFKYITCIEIGNSVTWLHFDVRNWDKTEHGLLKVSYYE